MKTLRVLLAFVCLTFVTTAVFADSAKGGLRYSITVTKFDNAAGWSGRFDIGDAWGTVLTDLLNQTGKFIVLGEKDMRAEALNEQDFAASGRTAGGKKAPVTGQMTPAQLLVKGKITHVQDNTAGGGGGVSIHGIRVGGGGGKGEVNATIYIVDSTTGQVLASKSVVGVAGKKALSLGYSGAGFSGDVAGFKNDNVGKAVESACEEAVKFLTDQLPKIPWSGTVVQVAGGKVYINRGTREGVSVGQNFIVGTAEVIRDPDSGEVLDTNVTEVARLEVTETKEKLSIARITKGSPSSVRKGMEVSASQQ